MCDKDKCDDLFLLSSVIKALISGQGKAGADGKSAYEVAVSAGYQGDVTEWLTSLIGKTGETGAAGENGKDGAGVLPTFYHADLSTAGKQIEVPFAFLTPPTGSPRVLLKLAYATPETISIALKATGNPVTIDFFSLDNTKLSTNYVSAGEIMNQSNQSFHTWLRIKHPLENTWWLYELTVAVSAKGARTDIWVTPLYENSPIEWK